MPSETMSNAEAIQMMDRCIIEIKSLRGQIAKLQPKADAYDNIAIVLNLLPKQAQGYGEDLVYNLTKRIQELQPKPPVEKV